MTECSARRHDTRYAYIAHRCRCPSARAAAAAYQRERRRRIRAARPGIDPAWWRDRNPDVDDIAVERACYGDRVPLTIAERRAAVARMTRAGASADIISERIGLSARRVHSHRAALRLEGAL